MEITQEKILTEIFETLNNKESFEKVLKHIYYYVGIYRCDKLDDELSKLNNVLKDYIEKKIDLKSVKDEYLNSNLLTLYILIQSYIFVFFQEVNMLDFLKKILNDEKKYEIIYLFDNELIGLCENFKIKYK